MPITTVPGVALATPRTAKSSRAHPTDIWYVLHGDVAPRHDDGRASPPPLDVRPCVVFVAGLGATANMWCPQVEDMLRPVGGGGGDAPVRVLTLDNRGCGRSGSPRPRAAYSTAVMAADVLAVLVRWRLGVGNGGGKGRGGGARGSLVTVRGGRGR